mgnify:FL=1
MHPEQQYLDSLRDILSDGEKVPNRTGVDTYRLLGLTHRYNFKDGFPLFTTKKVWMKGIVHELLWFLSGSTNIKYLVDNGVNIWNDDAYRYYKGHLEEYLDKDTWLEKIKKDEINYGDLGPVYGKQWRCFEGGNDVPGDPSVVDQIEKLTYSLKNNPTSRRHILTAWNPAEIEDMALPACHVLSQFTIMNGNKLWCQMYQRSCDMMLGVPFNVASYSLLTYMLAQD